jgi:hypothetical protein
MAFEFTSNIEDWDQRCIVCNKSVEHGGGFCHLNIGEDAAGPMVALCCPHCLETFESDQRKYVTLRLARTLTPRPLPPGQNGASPS